MLSAVGPVNRGMGGAATAAPLDTIGAIHWNPATICAIPNPQVVFGLDFLLPRLDIDSSITGVGSGTTSADPGVTPIPSVGWVHKSKDQRYSFGLGVLAVAGFKTNFPASTTNPVLAPQSNMAGTPGGLGRVFTQAHFLQLVPTVAVNASDQLSFGVSPVVTLAEVTADPLVVAAPDDADLSGAPRYPRGSGSRVHWGGGVQMGMYYTCGNGWHLGASVKSPQWMEEFRFHTEDEVGLPRYEKFKLDLPMILSAGTSYAGSDGLVVAADVRYFDYKNTDGFRDEGFLANGAVAGLGWRNVLSISTGVQYRWCESLYLRMGYTFNENPIPNAQTMANLGTPLFYQHELHLGTSTRLSHNVWLNLAYTHYFENEISGPIVTALGAVPGSSVTSRESVHVGSVGVLVNY